MSCTVIAFVIIILEHIDAFDSSWHAYRNSVMVEIRILLLLSFMKSHFHFLLTVVFVAAYHLLLQWPKNLSVVRSGP